MQNRDNSRHVLMAVLAHPDDETFGMGGTLALYAKKGAQVYLVCATRGEAGDVDPEFLQNFNSIAECREHELRCAAQQLGLGGVYFLDYRDSGMPGSPDNHRPGALAAAPLDEVVARVVHYMRWLQPQVILTFDPIGGYRHPDHIAIHQATVRAFKQAANPDFEGDSLPAYQPQKLYFHTISRTLLRIAVRLMPLFGKDPHKWGHNQDIDLADLAFVEFPIHAVIDFSAVRDRKAAASACHASQGGSAMIRGLMGWIVQLLGSKESFTRAYPPPHKGLKERDLFAGVEAGQEVPAKA